MKAAMQRESDGSSRRFAAGWSVLRDPAIRRTLLLCIALQMLQQLSGINAIVYYTPQTLKEVRVAVRPR